MEKLDRDILSEYEYVEVNIEEITTMLWYIYEDYYAITENDIYTKANNYDRLGTYLINMHSLLLSQQKEMKEIIDKAYKEIKSIKQENENIESIS